MKLYIQEIKPCAKATYLVLMVLDHQEIRTEIVELEHGAVRGFHLKDPLFKDLLSVCGLAKQFSQDFWMYRDGQVAAFPAGWPDVFQKPFSLPHQDQCLQGQMAPQDLSIRHKIHRIRHVVVPEPPGEAFDTTFRLGAIGHMGGNGGQLGALARHNATDERCKGGQVPGDRAGGLARRIENQPISSSTSQS